MFKYANLVKETTSNKPASSATAFNLAGAATGHQTVVAGIATGNSSIFRAYDPNGSAWQIFVGTVTDAAPDTLSQDHLIESSTGSFIDWSGTGENVSPTIELVKPVGADGVTSWPPYGSTFFETGNYILPLGTEHDDVFAGAFATSGRVFCYPLVIPVPCLVKRYRFDLQSGNAAGRLVRGLLYEWVQDGIGDLISQGANLDCATTGIKEDAADLDDFVPPGRYWLASEANDANLNFLGVDHTLGGGTMRSLIGCNASNFDQTLGVPYYGGTWNATTPPNNQTFTAYANNHNVVPEIKLAAV